MRPSLRFLGLAVVGWAAFRATTLGIMPGALLTTTKPADTPAAPAVMATQFPPIEPIAPAAPQVPPPYQDAAAPYGPPPYPYAYPYGYPPAAAQPTRPVVVPVYVTYRSPPQAPPVQQAIWPLPEPQRQFYRHCAHLSRRIGRGTSLHTIIAARTIAILKPRTSNYAKTDRRE